MTTQKSVALVLGFASVASVAAGTASAQTVNFDENGNGRIALNGAIVPLVSLGNQPDPLDPAFSPLTYSLAASGAPVPVVPGDVLISETATANVPSDLLRFLPDGRLLVYSDRPESTTEPPSLADVGMTTFLQANRVSFLETGPENGTNGLFGYTPTPNQPGFFANAVGGGPTYNFVSDVAVPEPTSLAALAVAVGAALIRPRRRRHLADA